MFHFGRCKHIQNETLNQKSLKQTWNILAVFFIFRFYFNCAGTLKRPPTCQQRVTPL